MISKILKVLGGLLAIAALGVAVCYGVSRQGLLAGLEERSRIAQTELGPVQYSLTGESGPVILFAHGTPGGFNHSPFFSSRGLEGFRVLTPSRPGYMATPLEVGRTPEEQAAAYAALLDELDIEQVVVLAVSGGGPSALEFAALYPHRTLALVCLEALSQPSGEALDIPLVMRSDFLFWAGVSLVTAVVDGSGAGLFPPGGQQRILASPDGRQRVHEWLWSTWPVKSRLAGWRNDSQQFMRLALPLSRIKAPTLVLNGTEDEAAPYEDAEELAARIPEAQLYPVTGATHTMLLTHKDEVNAAVRDFLAEVLPQRADGVEGGEG